MTSGIISIFVWIHFKSAGCALASFLAGVVIDLDHLFDYYSNKKFTFSIKRIYYACLKMDLERIYILLHSYEVIALLWIAIYAFSLSNVWKAAAAGFTQHIIFDQITNPLNAFGYFLTYRALKRFKKIYLIQEPGE